MPRIQPVSRKMKVVTIAAPKGGSGKSTATVVLAAKAVQEGHNVALFDLNADQASLTQWWMLRGEPENPQLFDVENLTLAVDAVAHEGFDWLFIDTSPSDLDLVEHAVVKSDGVIIPVRASVFDIGAAAPIVEICKARRKPFAFLMSAVDTRTQFRSLNETAAAALGDMGPLLSAKLLYHVAHVNALTIGKAAFEINSALQQEADSLWTSAKILVGVPVELPSKRRAAHG
jgi:chromosome partitioning protein